MTIIAKSQKNGGSVDRSNACNKIFLPENGVSSYPLVKGERYCSLKMWPSGLAGDTLNAKAGDQGLA
jgi:hypothetical protein